MYIYIYIWYIRNTMICRDMLCCYAQPARLRCKHNTNYGTDRNHTNSNNIIVTVTVIVTVRALIVVIIIIILVTIIN